MNLTELLDGHAHQVLQGDTSTRISAGMHFDAHRMIPGALYIAVPGHREGGPEAIQRAVDFGAAAVLVEGADDVRVPDGEVCVVRVPDVRVTASAIAARYYGEPGRAMDVMAVTGTNGKTSVSYMVESVLRIAEGARFGVIGTSGSRIGDEMVPMPPSVLTTPESPDLQYLLGYMRDRGAAGVVLEATSMALLTHRVDDAHIDVGVFTNLTQDHLDDHGTMESYRNAKLRLFQGLCRRAVVNADDPVSATIQALMPGQSPHTPWTPRRTTGRATCAGTPPAAASPCTTGGVRTRLPSPSPGGSRCPTPSPRSPPATPWATTWARSSRPCG